MDISKIKLNSAQDRVNLVTRENMAIPGENITPWNPPEFSELIDRIKKARTNCRPVILSMGAHVIKSGLSRYLIALTKSGFITHIASNGAGSSTIVSKILNTNTISFILKDLDENNFIRIPRNFVPPLNVLII